MPLSLHNRMYEQGHCVVGIEVVRQAVEEFFSENSLKYDVVHHEQIQADCYQVLYVFYIFTTIVVFTPHVPRLVWPGRHNFGDIELKFYILCHV